MSHSEARGRHEFGRTLLDLLKCLIRNSQNMLVDYLVGGRQNERTTDESENLHVESIKNSSTR